MAIVTGVTCCRWCETITAITTSGKDSDTFTISFSECHFCSTFFNHLRQWRRPHWCYPPQLSSERESQVRVVYSTSEKVRKP